MRVLLLTHYYRPEIGAPQRRWDGFVKKWRAKGHQVTVITSSPHYPLPKHTSRLREEIRLFQKTKGVHGETVIRLPYFPHTYGILSRTIDHFFVALMSTVVGIPIARNRYDAVISSVPALASLIPGRVAAYLFRAPFIIEMRDAWPDLVTYTPGLKEQKGLINHARRLAHRWITQSQIRSQHVITTTDRFATVLRDRGAKHVTVIRNGVDLDVIPQLAPAHPRRGSLKVLYLGTLGRSQGLTSVVDAAGMASRGGVNLELRMVGDGAGRQTLMEHARKSSASVSVLGAVPLEEVRSHFEWADTVVVSLRGWKPFDWTVPSKLYEALASNRHVSAMLSGEAAEIIRDSGAGFVCTPEDSRSLAIHWLEIAQNPELLNHGDAGRTWIRQNSNMNSLSDSYLDVIRHAAQRPKPGEVS